MDEPGALAVFVAALATALATGLGAVPFLFVGQIARSWIGVASALAAGFMLAASALLFYEGVRESALRLAGGAVVGVLFVAWASRRLAGRKDVHFEALAAADARRALLLVGVIAVHSFAEGIGVGVAFGGGESLGAVTAVAIAIHNIPEGLAISLVLVPQGISVLTGRRVERFLEPAPAAGCRTGLPVRRLLRRPGSSRARLRRWRDALDGHRASAA